MKINKIRKILLVLMLGIAAFLINGVDVHAKINVDEYVRSEFEQFHCSVHTTGGSDMIIYVFTNGTFDYGFTDSNYSGNATFDPSITYSMFAGGSCPTIEAACDKNGDCLIGCVGDYCVDYAKRADQSKEEQKTDCQKNFNNRYIEYVGKAQKELYAFRDKALGKTTAKGLSDLLGSTDPEDARGTLDSITSNIADSFHKTLSNDACNFNESDVDAATDRLKNTMQTMVDFVIDSIRNRISQLELAGDIDPDQLAELEQQLDDFQEYANEKVQNLSDGIKTRWLSEQGSINIDDDPIGCDGLLGDNVKADIKKVLDWIKIGVPILLIILGSLDFGKAVLADDDKALSKASSAFIKRAIAAIAVFLAPFVIMYIINAVDAFAGGCSIDEFFGVILWII